MGEFRTVGAAADVPARAAHRSACGSRQDRSRRALPRYATTGAARRAGAVPRAEDAISIVEERYRDLEPELARNVTAASEQDLREWHANGQVHAVQSGESVVGVLAVAPGHLHWIEGEEINEEVVAVAHRGHGYAALAQAYWAAHRAPDRDRLLIGTIDRLNTVSRRTAEAAGRARVLDMVFVSLSAGAHPAGPGAVS